jgi:dCMP deaminase
MNKELAIRHLRAAYEAAAHSLDPSNQNGAVLVGQLGKVLSDGENNFAKGVKFTDERARLRPQKYRYFEHAERNAIYTAARLGNKVAQSTMYCPWAACCDCARGIIQSGVKTLVMHKERMAMTPERWADDVNEALAMLVEAQVVLEYYEGPIEGAGGVFVNGTMWNPSAPPKDKNQGNYFVGMGE